MQSNGKQPKDMLLVELVDALNLHAEEMETESYVYAGDGVLRDLVREATRRLTYDPLTGRHRPGYALELSERSIRRAQAEIDAQGIDATVTFHAEHEGGSITAIRQHWESHTRESCNDVDCPSHRPNDLEPSTQRPVPKFLDEDMPIVNERWRHIKTGAKYRIVDVGHVEANLMPCVMYTGATGTWVRPIREFTEKFERDTTRDPKTTTEMQLADTLAKCRNALWTLPVDCFGRHTRSNLSIRDLLISECNVILEQFHDVEGTSVERARAMLELMRNG